MFIKKTCQRFFIFTYKSKHVVTNSVHRFFSVRVPVETRNKFSRYTKYILASATAFSLSLYIASRQYTLCETADIVEDKILDKVIDHDIYDEAIRKSRDLLQRIKVHISGYNFLNLSGIVSNFSHSTHCLNSLHSPLRTL